jgi:hypothetical protein
MIRMTLLTASKVLKPAAVLLQLEGSGNDAITVYGGSLSKAAAPVSFSRGASDRAVEMRG